MARGIEYFTSLDQSFAKLFVTSEDKAFPLLCFAFAAARAGHLCIQVGQDLLLPKPFFLTKEEEEQRTLQAQCEEGLSSLSSSLCSHIEDPKTVITTPFCLYRQCF
ncbi:MAG: hypothetical protein FJZ58_07040, partial [Chlamydiae bacterium]|nr:hypothetical protein [Chlamydiota bacterium]